MRIQDILGAIHDVEDFMQQAGSMQEFSRNKVVYYAVLKALEIIGEACHHLPIEIRQKYPDVPWIQIKNFRNHLAHEYFGIDETVIWFAATDELPPLKEKLIQILASSEE